jgi:lipopolysaccharide transport system ATP-binding protein
MGHLRVRNLGKAYKRYPRKSGRLLEWLGAPAQHQLRWVLRDVSFDVAPGETVGIVGSNGAGKSTLLKLIAGTTTPTAGSVEASGTISALLELGIGFHPDFTGRQNVYMAGSIRGLDGERMAELMADIEEFAEIGDYLDQPIRVYSSGMQVRLAFSVATAIRPEILIIDEALSVGDAYFSHKSFERIRRFRDQGTTLLFVSHNPGAVKTLCDRALLLDQGQVIRDDAPDAVLDYYNAMIAVQQADAQISQTERETGGVRVTRSGSRDAKVESVELLCNGTPVRALVAGVPATIRVEVGIEQPLPELTVGILLRDRLGNDVFGTNTFYCHTPISNLAAGQRLAVEFAFEALQLGVGTFSLTTALHTKESHISANYDWWDRALVFQVLAGEGPRGIGVCRLPVSVSWTDRGSPNAQALRAAGSGGGARV